MRPNIEITHTLNGRVKDYAAEHDLDLPEAYRRIIETGLNELEAREETHDHEDTGTRDHEDSYPNPKVDHRIEEIVAEVSETWDDTPERLAARRAAAEAALALAVERGSLSKQEALDEVRPNYAIDGQNENTWWRKNVRPVLQEVGEHAPGRGYGVNINGD